MIVKRFQAKDMQEAMRKISEEMGPDAVILEQKFVRAKGIAGLFKKKTAQVTAVYDPTQRKARPEQRPAPSSVRFGSEHARQLMEIQALVKELSDKTRAEQNQPVEYSREVQRLFDALVSRDVSTECAREIADKTQAIVQEQGLSVDAVAHQLVLDRLGEAFPLKLKKFEQNVLLFSGPTGAGKTTTVAKLAGVLKFKENLKVGLINTDTYRVGAMEHIRIFAETMGIPVIMAYSEDDVVKGIKTFEDRDVVLIDTAGKRARDEEYQKELVRLIEKIDPDEVFLVLSASAGGKACKELIRNYTFMKDYKLIVTKLDETEFPGNVLNIVEYSKKRLAYVTVGQNVPEDIREADTQKLAESIVGGGAAY